MNRIQVLDCTLRDGGYCNDWRFGFENTKKITEGLIESGVDVVECGFISNTVTYDAERTKYTNIYEAARIIPKRKNGKLFVAMINYGEYDIDSLPPNDGESLDGIRVAFHKNDVNGALNFCSLIKEKGYLVFVQPMVSLNYTDEEFLMLINAVNEFKPYAFYIVDSFGIMKEKELIRLFYMVEHNLKEDILIGFHSHNNMQLAYSNAQKLVNLGTNRNLIIDTSIMGMGRGAGNLNTELFLDYLNENDGKSYKVTPLLKIIDTILGNFYQRKYWGYSLPNYISAVHNAHPNYASYLDSKKTLTFEAMNEIFGMMDENKRVTYDKKYIEELYMYYQEKNKEDADAISDFREIIKGKQILIIAPGKSSFAEREKIRDYAHKEDVITISVNFDYDEGITDFIFVSNMRRFSDIPTEKRSKCIVTTNINTKDLYLKVNYQNLLNSIEEVSDNAGLMLIKMLMNMEIKGIILAGMDGYSVDPDDNYAESDMSLYAEKEIVEAKNAGINMVIKEYQKDIEIKMLTKPKYIILAGES